MSEFKWRVSFTGRKSGAIGVRHKVETVVESRWPLDDKSVLAHCYGMGWEHIAQFKILSRPEGGAKRYGCDQCGHVTTQSTNHYGSTWSYGRVNTCPVCPPWAKYPEFGGATTWTCIDKPKGGAK